MQFIKTISKEPLYSGHMLQSRFLFFIRETVRDKKSYFPWGAVLVHVEFTVGGCFYTTLETT